MHLPRVANAWTSLREDQRSVVAFRRDRKAASGFDSAPHEAWIQLTITDSDPSTPVTVTVPGLPPTPRAVMLQFDFALFHFMAP